MNSPGERIQRVLELLRSVKFPCVKNRRNRYSLSDPYSFTGRKPLIIMTVYEKLKKTDKFFHRKQASSVLLYPIFWIPLKLSHLHTISFLIGGQLGQAFCKLVPFFANLSFVVSIQNLILIAVDRFGAVVFPLRSPLIRSKLCPFFILSTWIVAVAFNSPHLFTFELVESPEGTWGVLKWKKAFGESTSFASYQLTSFILFIFIPVLLLVIL